MREKISPYKYLRRNFLGQTLTLFFGKAENQRPAKVLILNNVVAYQDELSSDLDNLFLEITEGGSTYQLDIAIRLHRREIEKWDEVFVFMNDQKRHCDFRAVAEKILWRDFDVHVLVELDD